MTIITAEAAIDQFLVDHQDEVGDALARGREEIARGEGKELEPLEDLLRAARAALVE